MDEPNYGNKSRPIDPRHSNYVGVQPANDCDGGPGGLRSFAPVFADSAAMAGEQCNTTKAVDYGAIGVPSQELTLDNIEDAMHYRAMNSRQIDAAEQVRDVLIAAAKTILRNVPRSPRRTLALQHLIDARMDANCAISFLGRF